MAGWKSASRPVRIAIAVVAILIGLFAMWDGIKDIVGAFGGGARDMDVGGAKIRYEIPKEFCALKPKAFEDFKGKMEKLAPGNVVEAAFVLCDAAAKERMRADEPPEIAFLMVPTETMNRSFPSSKEPLDEVARSMKNNANVLEDQKTLDARLKAMNPNLSLTSNASLGVLNRDEDAVYFGATSVMKLKDTVKKRLSIGAMAIVKGRLVSFYIDGPFEDEQDAVRRLDRTRTYVKSWTQLNRE